MQIEVSIKSPNNKKNSINLNMNGYLGNNQNINLYNNTTKKKLSITANSKEGNTINNFNIKNEIKEKYKQDDPYSGNRF